MILLMKVCVHDSAVTLECSDPTVGLHVHCVQSFEVLPLCRAGVGGKCLELSGLSQQEREAM